MGDLESHSELYDPAGCNSEVDAAGSMSVEVNQWGASCLIRKFIYIVYMHSTLITAYFTNTLPIVI